MQDIFGLKALQGIMQAARLLQVRGQIISNQNPWKLSMTKIDGFPRQGEFYYGVEIFHREAR